MNRTSDEAPLFTPCALGELKLRNRVVMASMTRGRASNAELAPPTFMSNTIARGQPPASAVPVFAKLAGSY
jgi:2,4-dienoyl-CoA reductase-like NADH-dependent reductase (Old Yellow Enzyme family)